MTTQNKAYVMMVFATLLFAGAFVAGKLGASDFSPIVMTFLRIGIGTLILFPYMILKFKDSWRASFEELQLAFILGLVGMTFYHLFFFNALRHTSVTNASVINASMPILTAVLAYFFLKEKLTNMQKFFMFTAFIGVVLTITHWDFNMILNMSFNKGDLLMFCGTISWSVYGIIIRKGIKNTHPIKLTAYTFLFCTLLTMPFAMKSIIYDHALDVKPSSYYVILYMAIFPTVLGYSIQQYGIKTLGPSTASLFINLVPIFSIVLSLLILKEPISIKTYISGSIIILSVMMFTRLKKVATLKI